MGDLISRSATVEILREWAGQTEKTKSKLSVSVFYESAARLLERMPDVDAVPVVRCKDCVMHGRCSVEQVFDFCGMRDGFCCVGKKGAIHG